MIGDTETWPQRLGRVLSAVAPSEKEARRVLGL